MFISLIFAFFFSCKKEEEISRDNNIVIPVNPEPAFSCYFNGVYVSSDSTAGLIHIDADYSLRSFAVLGWTDSMSIGSAFADTLTNLQVSSGTLIFPYSIVSFSGIWNGVYNDDFYPVYSELTVTSFDSIQKTATVSFNGIAVNSILQETIYFSNGKLRNVVMEVFYQ